MSVASRLNMGSAAAMARIPSSAISSMMGLPSWAYSPSAACAIAFIPLVTVRLIGNLSVRFGSYITVRGSTRISLPVRFMPPSVRPYIGVISEPA